jgi:hypothetical protein
MNHNSSKLPGRYVVAKGAQIDTRKSDQGRAAAQPSGDGSVLVSGDAICPADLEGGAAQLEQMIKQGSVVLASAQPTTAPKSGLMVAPGQSVALPRGIVAGGAEIYATELRKDELEHLIERGLVLRVKPGAALSIEPPPEAA